MGAMQASGVILGKAVAGIEICGIERVDSLRAMETADLQCLADRVRAGIARTGEAE